MSFYTDVIQRDPRFKSTDTINDPALLEPGTRAAVAAFIAAAKAQGHDLRLAETYRSQARQHALWQRGATQLSKVGCHGYGVAADLELFKDGVGGHSIYDPDGQHYAFFQVLAVQVGLVSGIGWGTPRAAHTFTDWDHVQRVPIFRQQAMFAGTWYPPADYHPYDDMRAAGIQGMAPVPVVAAAPAPKAPQPVADHDAHGQGAVDRPNPPHAGLIATVLAAIGGAFSRL